MKEINLYIDESGNLGSASGRYFLICALEIKNINSSTSKRAARIINRYKKIKGISKSVEIKGTKLVEEDRNFFIDKILYKDVLVRYIVLDKTKATMLLKKADDKNACYNYLIQLLVKKITEDNRNIKRINLYLDNRTVKIGNRLALKPYLYNKLVLEQLEKHMSERRIEFTINYLESESCYLIQWADIIANSLYKKYNNGINSYYNKIKPYVIFESKFPSKNFGK